MRRFSVPSFLPIVCRVLLFSNLLFAGVVTVGQEPSALPDAPGATQTQSKPSNLTLHDEQHEPSKNHILWIIPNYRSDENSEEIKPLTPAEKMKVSLDDSFDPSALLVAGIFAGISMAERQYTPFGTGAQGFGKYYGGPFADQAIGNIMTEGLFPVALHQDPRYFVKGTGGFWKRTGYAISREFVTRGDDGGNQFNTSELAGNAVAAGISNFYYPASDRSFSNTADKWGQQIALDTVFNVTKEFWPDVRKRSFRH
jgi:hypothetical protein